MDHETIHNMIKQRFMKRLIFYLVVSGRKYNITFIASFILSFFLSLLIWKEVGGKDKDRSNKGQGFCTGSNRG